MNSNASNHEKSWLPFVGLGLGVAGVVSMFFAWAKVVGNRARNGFELLDFAVEFNILDNPLIPVLEVVWLFLPALGLAGPMLVLAGYSKLGWAMSIVFNSVLGLVAIVTAIYDGPQLGNITAILVVGAFLTLGFVGLKRTTTNR